MRELGKKEGEMKFYLAILNDLLICGEHDAEMLSILERTVFQDFLMLIVESPW